MLRLPPLLLIVLLGLLFGILRFLFLLPFRRRVPPYVELRLEGPLLWRQPRARSIAERLGKRPLSVERIERILEGLAKEPNLKGVVITTGALHASGPRRQAVAAALQRFRETGREVVLYWKEAGAADFALVPAADRILLAPGGSVLLLGYASTLTSVRGALDRLGVVPEFFRIGDHKTAPELFTDEEPSEIQREFVTSVLNARHRRLLSLVAHRKGGDEAWAAQVVDGGPYTSQRAVDAGLVDALVYPDELPGFLMPGATEGEGDEAPAGTQRAGAEGGPAGKARDRLPTAQAVLATRRWRPFGAKVRRAPRIVVVPISGIIKGGKSTKLPTGPALAGEETIVAQLDAARRDPSVKGVVVYGDSRGGAAPASELIWRAVYRLAQEKPTAAYVEAVAASGGYFAIAGAGRIFAAPGALLGSIGVFSGRFDMRKLLTKLGVHQEVVLRGAHAGLLSPAHELTEGEREVLGLEIGQVYDDFVRRVAQGRGREPEEIHPHGEGRVFVAEEAPSALLDEIGDLEAALAWTAQQAGLDPKQVDVRILRPRPAGFRGLPALVDSAQALGRTANWLIAVELADHPRAGDL